MTCHSLTETTKSLQNYHSFEVVLPGNMPLLYSSLASLGMIPPCTTVVLNYLIKKERNKRNLCNYDTWLIGSLPILHTGFKFWKQVFVQCSVALIVSICHDMLNFYVATCRKLRRVVWLSFRFDVGKQPLCQCVCDCTFD